MEEQTGKHCPMYLQTTKEKAETREDLRQRQTDSQFVSENKFCFQKFSQREKHRWPVQKEMSRNGD
jgi:hypothetical protein